MFKVKKLISVLQKQRKEKSIALQLKSDVLKLNGLAKKVEWHETGWPDLIVLMPGNLMWFVETKRPKNGVISARQKLVHRELRNLGFSVRLVWDNQSKQIFLDELRRTTV